MAAGLITAGLVIGGMALGGWLGGSIATAIAHRSQSADDWLTPLVFAGLGAVAGAIGGAVAASALT